MIFNLTNKTEGFYKKFDNKLSFAREFEFLNKFPGITYDYETPVDDWYWFNDIEIARAHFNMPNCRVEPDYIYSDVDPLIFYPEHRPITSIPNQE